MLPSFCAETVTRIRPGKKSLRGSTVPDWDNVTTAGIPGCSVQPAASLVSQDGRVLGVSDSFTLYAPPGSDIEAGDRVEWDGTAYLVVSAPHAWTSPTGRVSHLQCAIERWAG